MLFIFGAGGYIYSFTFFVVFSPPNIIAKWFCFNKYIRTRQASNGDELGLLTKRDFSVNFYYLNFNKNSY